MSAITGRSPLPLLIWGPGPGQSAVAGGASAVRPARVNDRMRMRWSPSPRCVGSTRRGSTTRIPARYGNGFPSSRDSEDVVDELPELGQVAALDHRHDVGVPRRHRVAGVPVPAVLGVEPPGVAGVALHLLELVQG